MNWITADTPTASSPILFFSTYVFLLFYPQMHSLTKGWLVVNRKYGKLSLSFEVLILCYVPLALVLGSTMLCLSPVLGGTRLPSCLVSGVFLLPEETCMHRRASGVIAGLVLERSCPITEVHPKRPPVISTPHHLTFHNLIACYKV